MPLKHLKRVARKTARKLAATAAPLLFKHYFTAEPRERVSWKGKRAAVTISFDPDYPEDVHAIPKLLEQLDSFGFRASFACVGKWIEVFPRIHDKILDAKNEIINHTLTHPNNELLNPHEFFNDLDERRMEEEIAGFERVCKKLLGCKPVGFRSPHFGDLHSQTVYEILERRSYLYSSSTNLTRTESRGFPYHPSKKNFLEKAKLENARFEKKASFEKVENFENLRVGYKLLELPLMSCPEHFFPVFDSWHCFHAFPPAHFKKGEFARLFARAIDYALEYGIHANFYFDPRDVFDLKDFTRALEFLSEKRKELWIVPSFEIARFWADKRKR